MLGDVSRLGQGGLTQARPDGMQTFDGRYPPVTEMAGHKEVGMKVKKANHTPPPGQLAVCQSKACIRSRGIRGGVMRFRLRETEIYWLPSFVFLHFDFSLLARGVLRLRRSKSL